MTALSSLAEVGQEAGTEAVECVLWSASHRFGASSGSWLDIPLSCASGFLNIQPDL